MIGLATNVIVRYLTRDDENQWQQASKLVESGQLCFVANIVLCELVLVLRGNPYKFDKNEILDTLEMMLQSTVFEFENRSMVYQALQRTKQGSGDFSDYLIGAMATASQIARQSPKGAGIAQQAGCQETATFDEVRGSPVVVRRGLSDTAKRFVTLSQFRCSKPQSASCSTT